MFSLPLHWDSDPPFDDHPDDDDEDDGDVGVKSEVSSELDPSEVTGARRRFCPHPTNINPNPSSHLSTKFNIFLSLELLDFVGPQLQIQTNMKKAFQSPQFTLILQITVEMAASCLTEELT